MRLHPLAAALCLSVPVFAQTAPHLIPVPREVSAKPEIPLANGVRIECSGCDADDTFAAADLRQTLAERGLVSKDNGFKIVLSRAKSGDSNFTEPMRAEGYIINASNNELRLSGASANGVFYAAQTAKQMFELTGDGRWILHPADIRDWPTMKYRGLSDDLSRGPVDTLEFQKKIVRTLAAYKDNLYSPYFEHTQQYASNPLPAPPGGSISAADARELVAYAKQYHVMIVPEQEAFGHLHHDLIYDQYQQVAETPHGAVLAPGQAGSLKIIGQMFGELANLYPGPFLHVGADETADLGKGQTKDSVDSQGLGKAYLDFMQQIDNTLRPLNRRLLFWGDIAQNSPDLLKAMPEEFKRNTVAIAWEYNPNPNGFMKYLNPFTSAGFETWVAPGINNWSRVYPNYNNGLQNIQQFTRDGQAIHAVGQLNTIWYDDGEALASNNWYGVIFGAAAAWQQGQSSIERFQSDYGYVFHGDATGKLNQAQQELMACHDLLKSTKVGDGSDLLFWSDPWAPDQQKNFAMIRPVLHDLRIHAEHAIALIAEARAAYPPPIAESATAAMTPVKTSARAMDAQGSPAASMEASIYTPTSQLPSNPTSLRETDAIDALELGARRLDFIGLKFELADEMSQAYGRALTDSRSTDRKTNRETSRELGDINGVNGRIQDIKDGYSMIRELYEQLWRRTNRPYGLRPVLEHYDYTIGLWLARMDKVRTAQRTWTDTHTVPSAAETGIPLR